LTKIFRKIGSTLGGWRSTTPANINILTPARAGKIISEVSGAKNKFLLPRGSEICLAQPATPKNGKISLGAILWPDTLSGHGAYRPLSRRKISALPDPQGGRYGGSKIFLPPFPPQNPIVKPPQNCVIMSDFVSPTNCENLVKILGPVFWLAYFLSFILYKPPYM